MKAGIEKYSNARVSFFSGKKEMITDAITNITDVNIAYATLWHNCSYTFLLVSNAGRLVVGFLFSIMSDILKMVFCFWSYIMITALMSKAVVIAPKFTKTAAIDGFIVP
ncbi:hypothetical protein [Providencia huaxiensis]|uniref:hypothetical protein n=1 Tax=Providencia huaxiensis TaxID=2027290 RepID=UPI0034E59BBD